MGGKHEMQMELEQSTCDGASRSRECFLFIIFRMKVILPCGAIYTRADDEGIYESSKLNSQ